MFSGIIEDLGVIVGLEPRGEGRGLLIRTGLPVDPPQRLRGEDLRPGLRLGDSVAVNGACLTVDSARPPDRFGVVCGRETLARTSLGALTLGSKVHLERALRVGDRLDGHLVSGHVDGLCTVVSAELAQESVILWVALPEELTRYVAEKGSICLDGTSLTVNEVRGSTFRVNLIPFTALHTRLAETRPGDRLNVEVDMVARYLERLLLGHSPPAGPGLSRERLVELGFVRPKESV